MVEELCLGISSVQHGDDKRQHRNLQLHHWIGPRSRTLVARPLFIGFKPPNHSVGLRLILLTMLRAFLSMRILVSATPQTELGAPGSEG
jgi:hypothetical protein